MRFKQNELNYLLHAKQLRVSQMSKVLKVNKEYIKSIFADLINAKAIRQEGNYWVKTQEFVGWLKVVSNL